MCVEIIIVMEHYQNHQILNQNQHNQQKNQKHQKNQKDGTSQQQSQQQPPTTTPSSGKRTLFGRRPLYIKKTSLKRIKSLNEKQQQGSTSPNSNNTSNNNTTPKVVVSPSGCYPVATATTATTTVPGGVLVNSIVGNGVSMVMNNREHSRSIISNKSNRSSNRNSAVSPFPKYSIMDKGKRRMVSHEY